MFDVFGVFDVFEIFGEKNIWHVFDVFDVFDVIDHFKPKSEPFLMYLTYLRYLLSEKGKISNRESKIREAVTKVHEMHEKTTYESLKKNGKSWSFRPTGGSPPPFP